MELQLRRILLRYFRPVIKYPQGAIVHMGDCQIHRSLEVYNHATCTCGLLHDLMNLGDWGLARKLYPPAQEDEARAEDGRRFEPEAWRRERDEEVAEILERVFGLAADEIDLPDPEIDNEHWALIDRVFGDSAQAIRRRFESEAC